MSFAYSGGVRRSSDAVIGGGAGGDPRQAGKADQPKIVVDSDWKSQARAEKERLEAQEKARERGRSGAGSGPAAGAVAGAAGGAGDGEGDPGGLPKADFTTLLGTMVTQALLYLGAFPDPQTGRAMVSLEHAKFHIDLLEVLETKTKGNLTAEEADEVRQTLSELRMRFVEISRAVATALERQQMQRQGGTGAGGLPDLRLGG